MNDARKGIRCALGFLPKINAGLWFGCIATLRRTRFLVGIGVGMNLGEVGR